MADALSRASFNDKNFNFFENALEAYANMIKYVSDNQLAKLKNETNKDKELEILKETIFCGWPDNKSKVDTPVRPYRKHRDVIVVNQGILSKGNQFIIPTSMRKDMISWYK